MNADATPAENIELKARLESLAEARQIAEQVAESRLPDQHQVDTYFVCNDGRLKLREINGQLAELIWYRRADSVDSRSSRYVRVPVSDPVALKRALAGSLGVWKTVDKQREIYLFQNVRIHLDQVDGIGACLEFEAVLERPDEAPAGHATLAKLRDLFAISPSALLANSYSDML